MFGNSSKNIERHQPSLKRAGWRRRPSLVAVNAALAASLIFLFAGYLVMNNKAAASGFIIRSVEREITELEEQRRRLDLQVLELQSMDSIEGRVRELGFIPVSDVDYLSAPGGAVAVK